MVYSRSEDMYLLSGLKIFAVICTVPCFTTTDNAYVSYSHTLVIRAMHGIHLAQLGFECLDQRHLNPPQVRTKLAILSGPEFLSCCV